MIAIIIVNYRKSNLSRTLVNSIRELKSSNEVFVVIVDNETTIESQAELRKLSSSQTVILAENENHGYFGGAGVGLSYLRSLDRDFEWIIVSNSDIVFSDQDFGQKLSKWSDNREVGVIAPDVLSELSGFSQNPYLRIRPSRTRMHLYKWIFSFSATCFCYQLLGLLKSVVRKRFEKIQLAGPPGAEEISEIYASHGSFLIFTKEYFKRGGDFAHEPFLFGEEVTVAETCRKLGLQITYDPSLRVTHTEHASMGWFPNSNILKWQRQASRFCANAYFSKRHS